jgi:transcriptional regulator with XRE-family HTH domain
MASVETLGDRIREARKARSLSQEKLAVELGVSWSTVNRYESGKNTPSLNRLRLIADVLDVEVADLLGRAA